jgi:hypothetical protein
VNGRLKFRDFNHLQQVASVLEKNRTNAGLDDWERKFPSFTSMRTAFHRLSSSEKDIEIIGQSQSEKGYENLLRLEGEQGNLEASRLIDNEILATLFNADGIVLFGNDAFKYGRNQIYVIRGVNEFKLSNLNTADEVIRLNRVKARSTGAGARIADERNHCIADYWHSGVYKRLVADYTLNQPFGASWNFFNNIDASAKHQRRRLGVWWADQIPSITLKVRAVFTVGSGINYVNTATDQNEVWYSNSLPDTGIQLQVTAEGTCDDWEFRTCTVTY